MINFQKHTTLEYHYYRHGHSYGTGTFPVWSQSKLKIWPIIQKYIHKEVEYHVVAKERTLVCEFCDDSKRQN
jgi:hypothetical protein